MKKITCKKRAGRVLSTLFCLSHLMLATAQKTDVVALGSTSSFNWDAKTFTFKSIKIMYKQYVVSTGSKTGKIKLYLIDSKSNWIEVPLSTGLPGGIGGTNNPYWRNDSFEINDLQISYDQFHLASDNYRLGVWFDANSEVDESDETNNKVLLGTAKDYVDFNKILDVYAAKTPFTFSYDSTTNEITAFQYPLFVKSKFGMGSHIDIGMYLINEKQEWILFIQDAFSLYHQADSVTKYIDYSPEGLGFATLPLDHLSLQKGRYRFGLRFDENKLLTESNENNNEIILGELNQYIDIKGSSLNLRKMETNQTPFYISNHEIHCIYPKYRMTIQDLSGKIILQCEVKQNSYTIPNSLSGLFVAKIETAEGTFIKKLYN